ncbi:hypothetical protein [Thiomonas sp.]
MPAGATTACIYAGGDTPNPIRTPTDVPVYALVRYWLPVWVRSNPHPTQGGVDAGQMVNWLNLAGAQHGITTVLDMETAVTPAYVTAYGAAMHAAGLRVLVYGSRDYVLKNPALNGYFVADPGWQPGHAPPGTAVAVQYAYAGSYDLSWITDTVSLWDRHPPQTAAQPTSTPTSTPTTPSTATPQATVTTLVMRNGHGWIPLPATWRSIHVMGPNPDATGHYVGPLPTLAYVSSTPGPHSPHGVAVFTGPDVTCRVIIA